MIVFSYILMFMLFSYISSMVALYLDARYKITDVTNKHIDFLFAVTMGWLVAFLVLFSFIGKMNLNINFHNKIIDLGDKHGKQDKDPVYQLEKAVFGDKK